MGTYIADSDVNAIFSAANLDDWADLDADGSPDTGRRTAGITFAEAYVEARFRNSNYATPFEFKDTAAQAVMKDIMARIAAEHVYKARGLTDEDAEGRDKVSRLADEARTMIAHILMGSIKPNLGLSHSGPTVPVAV